MFTLPKPSINYYGFCLGTQCLCCPLVTANTSSGNVMPYAYFIVDFIFDSGFQHHSRTMDYHWQLVVYQITCMWAVH